MVRGEVGTRNAYPWSCDNVTPEQNRERLPSTPTTMLPKTTKEHVANMMAQQAQLDQELAAAKEEAEHEEKQRAEEEQHAEEAVREKWKHKEEEAVKKKKKAARERREQAEAKAQVAHYEACVKMLVPAGEPILALHLDSEIESGVRLLGVTW